jgi:hypothetical protein
VIEPNLHRQIVVALDEIRQVALSADQKAFRTGAPGRPSAVHLVIAEHLRRLKAGESNELLRDEATALTRCYDEMRPRELPSLTIGTIMNRIREQHRKLFLRRDAPS